MCETPPEVAKADTGSFKRTSLKKTTHSILQTPQKWSLSKKRNLLRFCKVCFSETDLQTPANHSHAQIIKWILRICSASYTHKSYIEFDYTRCSSLNGTIKTGKRSPWSKTCESHKK